MNNEKNISAVSAVPKKEVTIHNFLNLTDNRYIKIPGNSLLFLEVSGRGKSIQKNDHIRVRVNDRSVEYLVFDIHYLQNSEFAALLIFLRFDNDIIFC
jgi:hypothetical protein